MVKNRIKKFTLKYNKEDKRLAASIKMISGSKPFNIKPYQIAIQHTSVAKSIKKGFKESNERLEYLGDAVLGMVVADYLFKKYPYKDEGFLTELRSRIVSRESLLIWWQLPLEFHKSFNLIEKERRLIHTNLCTAIL